jgi:hypothetical protein
MGILVRSGPLSHPEVQRTINDYCVPVAFDLCAILPYRAEHMNQLAAPESSTRSLTEQTGEQDPEIATFLAIQRQNPLNKGIWITTPDGKVLCSSYQVTAEPMLALLNATVADWRKSANGPPLPLAAAKIESSEVEVIETPDQACRLLVHGRLLDDSNNLFRDVIDLSRAECRQLVPETLHVGDSVALPENTLKRLVTRFHPGEMRLALNREDVRSVTAEVTITRIEAGVAHAELKGKLEVDGVWIAGGRRRQHQATLAGTIQWHIERQAPTAIEIVSDGTWQAEYPEGFKPGSDLDTYPGGPSGRLVMSPPMRMLFLAELTTGTTPASSN